MTTFDVTDATFQADVIERSATVVVIVDLWAEWCGPCKTLGPILEKVVAETNGKAVLAKVDVDSNPGLAQAFQAQSIPAVHAVSGGKVVDGFVGAKPEAEVREFVKKLLPAEEMSEVERLIAAGDEASLAAALEIEPLNQDAIAGMAALLIEQEKFDEALALIEKVPDTPDLRRLAAVARTVQSGAVDDIEQRLESLLVNIKGNDDARKEFVDLLEVLGQEDPRTAQFRKRLTSALY